MSILKAAFHDNPRCVALVNAFSEGVALHGVGSSDRLAVAANQQANGFELLRQLTLEFSLRSRSEALSLRDADCREILCPGGDTDIAEFLG